MQQAFIKQLSDVSRSNVKLVGGKAASLGEMIAAGIPVPTGFVITTSAFQAGMSLALEREILQAFDTLGSQRVAVRSSAVAEDGSVASWAGQLESYLNTTKAELLEAVTKCWRSIESDHAAAYATEHGVDESQQAVAVVVQAMVESETAGVLFTANPVTENRDEVVIEAAFGLGELLVQGMVTPENVRVNKATGKVLHRTPSKQRIMLVYKDGKNQEVPVPTSLVAKPIISDQQIKELSSLARKIEEHYNAPQDIEWAIAKNKVFIVQSRPITTLNEAQIYKPAVTFSKTFTREESLIFCEILGQELDKWLGDIVPTPPPAQVVRINQGLAETWLCEEATQLLINDVYKNNIENSKYLANTISRYKDLISQLGQHEKRGHARDLGELKQYLELFRQAVVPLHVIFFTPLHPDTPKPLHDLAVEVRGQDALFDNGDLYVRDSLVKLYPDCNGIETFIGLRDLEKPIVSKLKPRENDFIWFDGQYLSQSLGEFRDKHPDYSFKIEEIDRGQSTIEGSVAYRGVVEGKVQLILRKKEVDDFEAGNVLVAPMTTPHYLPAMRKAIAFVTDEGGVTCHAAIVAREMKTPCIIGTNIATEFLKNGDTVRVDANKGVITVLGQGLTSQPQAPKGVKYALTVPQSVLFADLSLQGSKRAAFRTVLGVDYEPEYIVIDGGGAMRWNYDTDQHFVDAMMKNNSSTEDAISDFIDGMEATTRLLDRQSRLVASNDRRHKASSADVRADLEQFWYAYELQSATLFSYWNMAIMLSERLTEKMLEHGLQAEIDDGLARFLKPYQPNYFALERHELAELASRFGSELKNTTVLDPELKKAIEHHVEYFGFLLTPYNLGSLLSVKDQLDRLSELTKVDAKALVFNEPEAFNDLPADVVRLAKLAQKFSFWKTERVDIMALADARVKPLYEQAANLLGVASGDLVSMTKAEILDSLGQGKLQVSAAELLKRQDSYCLVLNKGKIDFYQPSEDDDGVSIDGQSVLEGVSAARGVVQGKVRLLKSLDDAKHLKTGEVLVTTMTRPEMGVALDRAAAFVTDEGGLLCHAAIISREMKKPCVIATRNATKVLKTGDLVEVDGTQGLVRKL